MKYWLDWSRVKEISKNRDIVFYGRTEDWLRKSLRIVSPTCIVDSQSKFWGDTFEGYKILSYREVMNNEVLNPYFVITTGSYMSVIETLSADGLEAGTDYCCSPEYKDYATLDQFRNYSSKVIVTSPDYTVGKATRVSRAGGGVFEVNIGASQNDYNVEKKIDGQYRQIIKHKNLYIAVEHDLGELHLFDKDYVILEKFGMNSTTLCGIAYCDKNNIFYVSNTHTDIITILNSEFKLIEKIKFSPKSSEDRNSCHHINDITVNNGHLFVSYFSRSGFWHSSVYDGGVSVWDIEQASFLPIMENLYMPHTPRIYNGKFHICDSARGKLYIGTDDSKLELPGFLRGLDYNEKYYILGLSETMYYSRLAGKGKNIMLNAAIVLFDQEKNISRMYPLLDIANVHQIMFA